MKKDKERLISLLIVLVILLLLLPANIIVAHAESSKCGDNLTWTLEDDVLAISGMGDMYNYEFEYQNGFITTAPWGNMSFSSVMVGDGVTSIGDHVFEGCADLMSVTIPDSVKSIGNHAFYGCTCLTSVAIPDSVTSIGDEAFYGCDSLVSIRVGKTVNRIGELAFSNNEKLERLSVENGNAVFHSQDNCIIETEKKKLIIGCNGSIIPSDGSVVYIDKKAFYYCKGLKEIIIPNSVSGIGEDAFVGCESLNSLIIPYSVVSIGIEAFDECDGLTSINVEAGNPVYHSSGECIIETDTKSLILGCKNSTIPSDGSVTRISDAAFSGCYDLYSMTIPEGITRIGDCAFRNCYCMTEITIPNGLYSIGESAFEGCAALTSITIPDSVEYIETLAFERCYGLKSVTIPNSITRIGSGAFDECNDVTLYVNHNSYADNYAIDNDIPVIYLDESKTSDKGSLIGWLSILIPVGLMIPVCVVWFICFRNKRNLF